MPTIFDVAQRAGVSITTVSRALNGYNDVNESTRQRVLDAAAALHYYPNAAARSLRGKRTNTVVFAPRFGGYGESESFFKEFVGVLALTCFQHDLSLLATVGHPEKDARALYREWAGTGRVDGIIVADIGPEDERIAVLQDIGVPFVAFGRTAEWETQGYPLVDVDGAAGIRAVVAHLVGAGHRRIAYLSGALDASYARHRYAGYQAGLAAQGLAPDPRLVVHNVQDPAAIGAAVGSLLMLPPAEQPTAIIAASDHLALDVLRSLRAADRPVGQGPAAIAVTGFDDLPWAAYLQPALTTVRQPIVATCEALLDLLVQLMQKDKPPTTRQILLEPELVVRDSA